MGVLFVISQFSFSVQLLPLFISGPFLFIFLPRYLHISVSFWLHPCLSHHVSGLLHCLAFSLLLSFLSLSFPLFSLFSVFVTSFLCLSVTGWGYFGCLAFSFLLSPSAWFSSLSSRQGLATGPRTQVVRKLRRSLAVVVGEAGTVVVRACPGIRMLWE